MLAVTPFLLAAANSANIESQNSTRDEGGTKKSAADSVKIEITQLDSLTYTADSIEYNLKTNEINLVGNAKINYKKSIIKSDSIFIYLNERAAVSMGSSELFDGNETIVGNTIFYDIESEEGMMLNGSTEFEGGFYYGDRVRKVGDRTFDIDNARFTTCELPNPHYYIASPKLRLYLNDKIVAKPVVMYINHFPILALPFATFPIITERKSGFLIPEPGYNTTEGKFLKDLSYFKIFGDYGDILLSMDFMELTGFEFRLRGRYIKRYILNGDLNGRLLYYHIPGKDDYRIRWSFDSFHKQILSPTRDLTVRTDFVSDADIRQTSDYQEERMDRRLHSYLYYSQRLEDSNFNTTLDYQQDLVTDDRTLYSRLYYNKKYEYSNFKISGDYSHFNPGSPASQDRININLPSASFNLYSRRISEIFSPEKEDFIGWWDNLYISYTGNALHTAELHTTSPTLAQLFYQDTYDSSGEPITQHREGAKHSISLRYEQPIFDILDFNASLNYNEIWADKDKNNNKLVRGYDYNSRISLRTTIYGLFSPEAGNLQAVRHIIEPSFSYSIKPDFSQNDRFYSFGTININSSARSEAISFSLHNKLDAKILDRENKIKTLNNILSLNSSISYDFKRKPKGFSNITHTMSIMPYSIPIRDLELKLGQASFNITQDPYNFNIKQYNFRTTIGLNGSFSYKDYFPTPLGTKPGISTAEQGADTISVPQIKPGDKEITKPWNISFSYSYAKNLETGQYSGGVHTNLGFNLSQNWNVNYNNYYNFQEHKLVSQGINITRDLHCWILTFRWEKSGDYWSYRFQVHAKDLPELKFRHSDNKHYEW